MAKTNKSYRTISQAFMGGAIVAVVLAGVGYVGFDIWLASTQWMLVAAVLAMFGVYFRMDS